MKTHPPALTGPPGQRPRHLETSFREASEKALRFWSQETWVPSSGDLRQYVWPLETSAVSSEKWADKLTRYKDQIKKDVVNLWFVLSGCHLCLCLVARCRVGYDSQGLSRGGKRVRSKSREQRSGPCGGWG